MRTLCFGIVTPLTLVLLSACGGPSARDAASAAEPAMSVQDSSRGRAPAVMRNESYSPDAPSLEVTDADMGGSAAMAPMGYPQQAPPPPPSNTAAPSGPVTSGPVEASKQYLVYTAVFTLAVYQVESGLDRTEAIARELGGYLAMRGDNEITVRVPRAKFREALAQIEKIGDVLHRDVKAIDVTDEFVDTESRLKNARVMRDRLHALLAKAAVKEAIEIEKELGRVTEQIEVLEGKMKMLSDRIAFSTLTVHYAAKGPGDARPRFQLPFAWVRSLGVHHLLNFQPKSE